MQHRNLLESCAELPDDGPLRPAAEGIIETRGGFRLEADNMVNVQGVGMKRWQAVIAEIRLQDLARSFIKA